MIQPIFAAYFGVEDDFPVLELGRPYCTKFEDNIGSLSSLQCIFQISDALLLSDIKAPQSDLDRKSRPTFDRFDPPVSPEFIGEGGQNISVNFTRSPRTNL